jgi:hypothetical protein
MKFVPSARPMQPRAKTAELLLEAGITAPVAILGKRGYYTDTMGKRGVNDRGIYDDAIFVFSSSCHVAFNANTDPSVYRDGIATLVPGVWQYKLGTHGLSKPAHLRYRALVQAAPVTKQPDGGKQQTGWFGINIHRGSYNSTSSLGCQTIYPDQWPAFLALVEDQMSRFNQKIVPYLLVA